MPIHVLASRLAQQNGDFEPQRQDNFALEIVGLRGGQNDSDIITLSLATGFVPRLSHEEVAIPYGNSYVYVAGKMVWDAGNVVLRDWVDRNTADVVKQWQLQVGNPSTGQIGLARNYKKIAYVVLFGPNSTGPETGEFATFERQWQLVGAWPIAVNYSANTLDQSSSGQVMIEMTLRYDLAKSQFGQSGLLEQSPLAYS